MKATQSLQNGNFVIKGFKRIIVSIYRLMLAIDNQAYIIGKVIL